MRSVRLALSAVFLMSVSLGAFAQHEGHGAPPAATDANATATPAVPSEAKKAFKQLKALAGSWEGPVTTTHNKVLTVVDPALSKMDGTMKVSLQVTSSGQTLTHEMSGSGPHVNPVTVFYLDEERLLLTHYCAMGNRPRMEAKTSPDGKVVEFNFLDVDGGTKYGHMHHAVFTFVDEDHHNEDWDFFMPGDDTPVRAHVELHRVK
jgi:hypothetical protein